MKKFILIKKDGIVSELPYTKENIKGLSLNHLCRKDCKDCCTNCSKILDEHKPINEYSYISDGWQVLDENRKVYTFYVNRCSNYKKDEREISRRELRLAEEALIKLYYGVGTVGEAMEIQKNEYENGEIESQYLMNRKLRP